MNYKIHNKTIFIEANGIIGHYLVNGDEVMKIIEHYSGDQLVKPFHKLGNTATNSEAQLLNQLREESKI